MPFHAHGQGLQPQIDVKGSLRRLADAHVAHELHPCLDDVGRLAESLRVHEAVIGGVRLHEFREARARRPVEAAAVHDDPAHLHGMAVHVLGGGMDHDIRAEIQRPAEDGRGEGIVHDEGKAVGMGDAGQPFDVQHVHGRIGQGLAEDGLRFRADGRGDLRVRRVLIHKGHLDAHTLERHGKEVEGAAIDAGRADDMIAAAGQIEHGQQVGGLPGRGAQRAHAALERGDLLLHRVHGGIAEAGIEKALGLKVEKLAYFRCGSIGKGRALDNGQNARFAIARRVPGIKAEGRFFHAKNLAEHAEISSGILRQAGPHGNRGACSLFHTPPKKHAPIDLPFPTG